MEEITIDGVPEQEFRRIIEAMLRHGEADEAARHLRTLVEPHCGSGKPLSGRFLQITSSDITLNGWGDLEESLNRYDRPEHPVSAISIMVSEPESRPQRPDEAGLLSPFVEVSFFSDEAYPFTEADRADLMDGYSSFGCEWAGDVEGIDHSIAIDGIDDLYGGLAALEARLFNMDVPPEADIAAGTVASCYLAVLIHQAVRDTIRKSSLPRPLCVMAGNNGTYPFFDAPVMSADEYIAKGKIVPLKHVSAPAPVEPDHVVAKASDEDAYEAGSLLGMSMGMSMAKPKKKMALVLADDDLNDNHDLMAEAEFMSMGGVASGLAPPPAPRVAFDFNPPQAWEQSPDDIFDDAGSFQELGAGAPPVDYNRSEPPAEPEPDGETEEAQERFILPSFEEPTVPEQPVRATQPGEAEIFVPTGRVPQGYEPQREPEYIDTGDHDVWGALTSRMPTTAPGAFGNKPEDAEPQQTPGQIPTTRGHSLRKAMITFEPVEEAVPESAFSKLLRMVKGWFGMGKL